MKKSKIFILEKRVGASNESIEILVALCKNVVWISTDLADTISPSLRKGKRKCSASEVEAAQLQYLHFSKNILPELQFSFSCLAGEGKDTSGKEHK